VDLAESSVAEFCARFPEDEFYVNPAAALEAVRGRAQFNIIHPASGLKVDVMVPQSTPFNESRVFLAVLRPWAGRPAREAKRRVRTPSSIHASAKTAA
jgi:hypothetical protein